MEIWWTCRKTFFMRICPFLCSHFKLAGIVYDNIYENVIIRDEELVDELSLLVTWSPFITNLREDRGLRDRLTNT